MDLKKIISNFTVDKEALASQLMAWSNINSGSYNLLGLQKMADVLIEAFSVLGAEQHSFTLPAIEEVDEKGTIKKINLGPLLQFRKRPEAPIQVLLVGHMDTVFGVDHTFQRAVRVSPKVINGPGVTDMKGGLCVLLEALKIFENSEFKNQLGWEVLINPDEEIGSFGSAPILVERAKFHQVGLLFEPAMDEQGTLAGERKGSANFVFVVHGRAAHAGRDFHQGRNAIAVLAKVISAIDALNGQRDGVTLNVGQAEGGGAVNVVPDLALCRLDVRIMQQEDAPWVQEQLTSIVEKANQQEGFKVELHGSFNRKPKKMVGKTAELYQLVKGISEELGEPLSWKLSGGCCDGNNLAEAGLPNVDSLGVCGGKIHSEEEYILVDSLASRTKLIAAILFRLSENKL